MNQKSNKEKLTKKEKYTMEKFLKFLIIIEIKIIIQYYVFLYKIIVKNLKK